MAEGGQAPNWFPDPWVPGRLRYWDGRGWTGHVCVPVSRTPSAWTSPPASPGAIAIVESVAEATVDLAENRPGDLLRARAGELHRSGPFRSLVARVLGVHTEEWAFRVGAAGEAAVAKRLAKLEPARWKVIHSVPVGSRKSDIDHVVVGPPGVFTLNTKHHPRGNVWVGGPVVLVNGQRVPYVRNSNFEAKRAAALLEAACGFSVPVQAAIVVIAFKLQIREQPRDVRVVASRTLTSWLTSQPAALSSTQVDAVYECARRETTWRSVSA